MSDQVPDDVKAARNTAILEVAGRVAAERSARLPGRVMDVLVDGPSRRNPADASGRTRCNRVVNFGAGGAPLRGTVVPVRITEALPHSLRGELAGVGQRGVS